ncbi:hypothetical protein [Allohahella marinimesophila]|uniref:Secreted protein with PEP-CTERM sorting signal n=1 Tax=Allohahella marinimesophila TaxID=1054972 RepID=A0ABP7P8P7_9GAMM
MNTSAVVAAPIGALAFCSVDDDTHSSTPEERCAYTFSANGSLVESGAEARLNDGRLAVRSKRGNGSTPLQRVQSDVSDTIFFTGGDPAGSPVEMRMQVYTSLTGELAEMDAFLSMNIESTDGSSVGGFAAGVVARLDGEHVLIPIAAEWAPGWTVLDGGIEQISVTPDGMLTEVAMYFDWQPEFKPLHFAAGLSLWDFSGEGQVLAESYNSGIELIVPEGVTLVTSSGQFLIGQVVPEVPAPATFLLGVAGLLGMLYRKYGPA